MKHLILFAVNGLLWGSLYSQSASPNVIGNAGTHATTANAQASWTVGEVVTQTVSSGSTTATQGFHQTLLTVVAIDPPIADFHVEVYPNPASTELNIRFDQPINASLQVVDLHGRVVLVENADEAAFRSLNVTQLSQGSYVLRILGEVPSQVQQFKIQVIHTH